jgi:DNA-binding CsgD family transcriptional regulator
MPSLFDYDERTMSRLTAREGQVAILLADGVDTAEIARRMGISRKTLACHRLHVYQKLEVGSRKELAVLMAAGMRSCPEKTIP